MLKKAYNYVLFNKTEKLVISFRLLSEITKMKRPF